MRPLLFVLVLVAALAVGADRGGALLASRAASAKVAAIEGVTGGPTVRIPDVPFLDDAATRRVDRARVRIPSYDTGSVVVTDVDAELRDVVVSDGLSTATAGSVDGTGRISYADLQALAPVAGLTFGPDPGGVSVAGPVEIGGLSLDVVAVAELVPDGRSVRVVPTPVSIAGVGLPDAVASRIAERLAFPVDLSALPDGMSVTGITSDAEGLLVAVTGSDMPLTTGR